MLHACMCKDQPVYFKVSKSAQSSKAESKHRCAIDGRLTYDSAYNIVAAQ